MAVEMHAGLASEGGSKLKMIISYADALPSGKPSSSDCNVEWLRIDVTGREGAIYALDLGGTNFRVLRIQLGGKEGRVIKQEHDEISIPPHLMTGGSNELFDFIASALAKFVASEGEDFHLAEGRQREFGFTFSFPVKQTSIASGTLIKWTKGFSIDEMVSEDAVTELSKALERQGLDMKIMALGHWLVGDMMIMMSLLLLYLVRVLMQHMWNVPMQFLNGMTSCPSQEKWTPYMSMMQCDKSPNLRIVGAKMKDILGVQSTSLKTRRLVVDICDIVAKRAARLAASGIHGILKKLGRNIPSTDKKRVVIAIDSGLYEHYSIFSECLESTLRDMLGEEDTSSLVIKLAKDGSGIGAALLAAAHSQYREADEL
ncbi:hypothetical protein E2562_009964 [Oryza meyeriana var. granulata]|uniref:Phosphotransferase n=1 Tax=Oryza meyeriana var. granulata TaxID=110450 RepID=A0A6G1EHP5_9ORYZ|nr:hypothetical protein E2562_009964 [Oryza meyeriana var. granulata]